MSFRQGCGRRATATGVRTGGTASGDTVYPPFAALVVALVRTATAREEMSLAGTLAPKHHAQVAAEVADLQAFLRESGRDRRK